MCTYVLKRLMELEEGTGSEESDKRLLSRYILPAIVGSVKILLFFESCSLSLSLCDHVHWLCRGDDSPDLMMTQNVRSCVIYRLGQKSLTKKFLKEAEHLLELSILEEQAGTKKSSWVWKQKMYIYIYLARLERHSLQLFTILPYYFSLNTWWKRADAQLFIYCLYLQAFSWQLLLYFLHSHIIGRDKWLEREGLATCFSVIL